MTVDEAVDAWIDPARRKEAVGWFLSLPTDYDRGRFIREAMGPWPFVDRNVSQAIVLAYQQGLIDGNPNKERT